MDWRIKGRRPDSPQTPMFEAFLCIPRAHLRKESCTFSCVEPLIFFNRPLSALSSHSKDLIIELQIVLCGAQIGAPYRTIGFISESNRVVRALNDTFDLIITRLSPNSALMAFVLRLVWAVVKDPE